MDAETVHVKGVCRKDFYTRYFAATGCIMLFASGYMAKTYASTASQIWISSS